MPDLAEVFRRYGGAYLERFGDALPPGHRRAIEDILRCRTAALGGHVYACDHCGHHQYAYHSCRNRSCPTCHRQQTENWLTARRQELLSVPYFHIVFTLPKELRRLVRRHQARLYHVLMNAAAQSLIKLAADPRYVGGQIGVLAVLHTWTRTLEYHPHVHCLVPAGGVGSDGHWLHSRQDYLVPVRALSRLFRGLFTAQACKAVPGLTWPQAAWRQDWVVYCKPTLHHTDTVLEYLGRYVHRAAITNRRILSIDDGQVTFRYQSVGDPTWKTMTLRAEEFIRRFLQHVLPKGVHKVRYYGLWAPSNRSRLRQIQQELAPGTNDNTSRTTTRMADSDTPEHGRPDPSPCPICKVGLLRWLCRVEPIRAPPTSAMACHLHPHP